MFGDGYTFKPGKDDIVRKAPAGGGYVVAFGEALYRALDAVIRLVFGHIGSGQGTGCRVALKAHQANIGPAAGDLQQD